MFDSDGIKQYTYNYCAKFNVGLGGIFANIVQLGLDQLHDASTKLMKSLNMVDVDTL